VHDIWNIATSLLFALAVALIAYGLVVVASAWLAGPTRPARAIRKFIAPSLRDSPAIAYCVVGGLLLLLVAWGPAPAARNIWWILFFAALLPLGVTCSGARRHSSSPLPPMTRTRPKRHTSSTRPPDRARTLHRDARRRRAPLLISDDNDLVGTFQRCYPGLMPATDEQPLAA